MNTDNDAGATAATATAAAPGAAAPSTVAAALPTSASSSSSWLPTTGQLVQVARRMGPGMNQPGGVARITAVHGDNQTCRVKYVLDGRQERSVAYHHLQLWQTARADHDDGRRALRDRSLLLGRCHRCGALRKDCQSCDYQETTRMLVSLPPRHPGGTGHARRQSGAMAAPVADCAAVADSHTAAGSRRQNAHDGSWSSDDDSLAQAMQEIEDFIARKKQRQALLRKHRRRRQQQRRKQHDKSHVNVAAQHQGQNSDTPAATTGNGRPDGALWSGRAHYHENYAALLQSSDSSDNASVGHSSYQQSKVAPANAASLTLHSVAPLDDSSHGSSNQDTARGSLAVRENWRRTAMPSLSSSDDDDMRRADLRTTAAATRPARRYDDNDALHVSDGFVQPEGNAERLPADVPDLTLTVAHADLPKFFDDLLQQLDHERLRAARTQMDRLVTNQWNLALSVESRKIVLAEGEMLYDTLLRDLIQRGTDQCRTALRKLNNRRLYRQHQQQMSEAQRGEFRSVRLDMREFGLDEVDHAIESFMAAHRTTLSKWRRNVDRMLEQDDVDAEYDTDDGFVDPGNDDSSVASAATTESDIYLNRTKAAVMPSPVTDHPHARRIKTAQSRRVHGNEFLAQQRSQKKRKRQASDVTRERATETASSNDDSDDTTLFALKRRASFRNRNTTSGSRTDRPASDVSPARDTEASGSDDLDGTTLFALERRAAPSRQRRTNTKSGNSRIDDRTISESSDSWRSRVVRFDKQDENSPSRRRANRQFSSTENNKQIRRRAGDSERCKRSATGGMRSSRPNGVALMVEQRTLAEYRNLLISDDRGVTGGLHVDVLRSITCGGQSWADRQPSSKATATNTGQHDTENARIVLATMSIKALFDKVRLEYSVILQESVATRTVAELDAHVSALCQLLGCITKSEHVGLIPTDGKIFDVLCPSASQRFVDHVFLQAVDALWALLHPAGWCMKLTSRKSRVLLVKLLLTQLSKLRPLAETLCKAIRADLPVQKWHIGRSENAFVSCLTVESWTNVLNGLPGDTCDGSSRYSQLGVPFPRVEVDVIWAALLFVAGCDTKSSSHPADAKYFWKVVTDLFSKGSLYGLEQENESVPPSMDHIDAIARDMTCLSVIVKESDCVGLKLPEALLSKILLLAVQMVASNLENTSSIGDDVQPEHSRGDPSGDGSPIDSSIVLQLWLETQHKLTHQWPKTVQRVMGSCCSLMSAWKTRLPPGRPLRKRFEMAVGGIVQKLLHGSSLHPVAEQSNSFLAAFADESIHRQYSILFRYEIAAVLWLEFFFSRPSDVKHNPSVVVNKIWQVTADEGLKQFRESLLLGKSPGVTRHSANMHASVSARGLSVFLRLETLGERSQLSALPPDTLWFLCTFLASCLEHLSHTVDSLNAAEAIASDLSVCLQLIAGGAGGQTEDRSLTAASVANFASTVLLMIHRCLSLCAKSTVYNKNMEGYVRAWTVLWVFLITFSEQRGVFETSSLAALTSVNERLALLEGSVDTWLDESRPSRSFALPSAHALITAQARKVFQNQCVALAGAGARSKLIRTTGGVATRESCKFDACFARTDSRDADYYLAISRAIVMEFMMVLGRRSEVSEDAVCTCAQFLVGYATGVESIRRLPCQLLIDGADETVAFKELLLTRKIESGMLSKVTERARGIWVLVSLFNTLPPVRSAYYEAAQQITMESFGGHMLLEDELCRRAAVLDQLRCSCSSGIGSISTSWMMLGVTTKQLQHLAHECSQYESTRHGESSVKSYDDAKLNAVLALYADFHVAVCAIVFRQASSDAVGNSIKRLVVNHVSACARCVPQHTLSSLQTMVKQAFDQVPQMSYRDARTALSATACRAIGRAFLRRLQHFMVADTPNGPLAGVALMAAVFNAVLSGDEEDASTVAQSLFLGDPALNKPNARGQSLNMFFQWFGECYALDVTAAHESLDTNRKYFVRNFLLPKMNGVNCQVIERKSLLLVLRSILDASRHAQSKRQEANIRPTWEWDELCRLVHGLVCSAKAVMVASATDTEEWAATVAHLFATSRSLFNLPVQMVFLSGTKVALSDETLLCWCSTDSSANGGMYDCNPDLASRKAYVMAWSRWLSGFGQLLVADCSDSTRQQQLAELRARAAPSQLESAANAATNWMAVLNSGKELHVLDQALHPPVPAASVPLIVNVYARKKIPAVNQDGHSSGINDQSHWTLREETRLAIEDFLNDVESV